MDMLEPIDSRRIIRLRTRQFASSILLCSALIAAGGVRAGMYQCVDSAGAHTYSDRPCAPSEGDKPAQSHGASPSEADQQVNNAKVKKAAHVLDILRIAPSEPETFVLQRTVDEAAPDLVKALDPENGAWTPANGRWHSVSEFVKADLRRDVQTALRVSAADMSRTTASQFASRADESDLDVVLKFLSSTDGAHYLAMQSEVRHIVYDALASLLAQEAVPEEMPNEATLRRRQELLSLTLDYRIAKDGGGPPPSDLGLGSAAVMDYSARHDGPALDAIVYEYELELPKFHAFIESPAAKKLFRALEPAVRTYLALESTATTDFAELELDKYFLRWRAVYGSPVRSTARTSVIVRGRTIMISHITQTTVNTSGSPEGMAIACEQRESSLYQSTHRASMDYNAQAAALKAIQNRCRTEQRLPPL